MNPLQGRVLAYRIVAGFLAYIALMNLWTTFESDIISLALDGLPIGEFRRTAEEHWVSIQEAARRFNYGLHGAELLVAVLIWKAAIPLARRLGKAEPLEGLDLRSVNGIVASAVGLFMIASTLPALVRTGVQTLALWGRLPERTPLPIDSHTYVLLIVRLLIGFTLLMGWKGIGAAIMRARTLGTDSIGRVHD